MNSDNLLVVNPKRVEKIRANLIYGGKDNLHVLSDFDKTLTRAFVDGQKAHTVIAQVRQGNYLTSDYSSRAHQLFEKYHPIEIDRKISPEEKKKKMHEWWKIHFELLVECGLDKKTISEIVSKRTLKFREGCFEFLDLLYKNKIPLVVMSAAMGDMISEYLKQENKMYSNIKLIANFYDWDKKGKAVKVREPIIHSVNKDELIIKDFPEIFKVVSKRKNVILLGDSLEDPDMITGFDSDNILKIGFLNENVSENLPYFKEKYDVLILNDGNMDYVNKLMGEIIK
ncbi:hypothetical protein J4474_01135 [Candidatus Pacearchaeota archaeon]|nr:hypothetical protein [Candidatus Pacearchaeota archaeon]